MKVGDILYRYEGSIVGFLDEFEEPSASMARLDCCEWRVERMTDRTAFLRPIGAYSWSAWKPKQMRLGARRRFAWPTKEEALESFRQRRLHQIGILEYQLRRARMELSAAESTG